MMSPPAPSMLPPESPTVAQEGDSGRFRSAPEGGHRVGGLESQGTASLLDRSPGEEGALESAEHRSTRACEDRSCWRPGKTHQEGQKESCPELKQDVKSGGSFSQPG